MAGAQGLELNRIFKSTFHAYSVLVTVAKTAPYSKQKTVQFMSVMPFTHRIGYLIWVLFWVPFSSLLYIILFYRSRHADTS